MSMYGSSGRTVSKETQILRVELLIPRRFGKRIDIGDPVCVEDARSMRGQSCFGRRERIYYSR